MLQAAAVRGQGVVQVEGWVAADVGGGLWGIEALFPVPVYGQQCDGVSMGVHTCPCRVGWDGVGPVHAARVVHWQDHPLLPATCEVAGLHAHSAWVSLLFWGEVEETKSAGLSTWCQGLQG